MRKHLILIVACLTAFPAVAAPTGRRPLVEDFQGIHERMEVAFNDLAEAAKASRSVDVNSPATACFTETIYGVLPMQSALLGATNFAVMTALMKNQDDRKLVVALAHNEITMDQKLVAQSKNRLSEISGFCAEYGGVIDKVRSMREVADEFDNALDRFKSRIAS